MVWPFTSNSNSNSKDKEKSALLDVLPESAADLVAHAHQVVDETATRTMKQVNVDVPSSVQPYLIATTVFGIVTIASMFYRTRLRRIPTSAYLTPDMLQGRRVLRGKVTSVGDADNFRFYHTPGGVWAGWGWLRHVPKANKELKGQTMHIRLAGVDAPEAAHFGMPAQPFSKEALAWLRKRLNGKTVFVKPYARDRYDRIVSMAMVPRFLPFLPKKNVSLEMLKVGYGQVYKQAGAEYGGLLTEFERVEAKARAKKKGIWSQADMVSAAEHKKQFLRGGDN